MKTEIRLSGLDGVLDSLKHLPADIVSKNGGPVKLALAKGARLIRDQARINLNAAIQHEHGDSTGLLEQNVIASRGKALLKGNGERYLVRVRRKAYDGEKIGKREKAGKRVTTQKTAHLLEYGSSRQLPRPWLRPAFAAQAENAIRTIETDLARRIKLLIKKHSLRDK